MSNSSQGDAMENLPTAVGGLALSMASVVAGGSWLVWLRSKGTTWSDAFRQRQIQGFNGLLLVAFGLMGAIEAVVDLIPALTPYREAIRFVITPVGVLVLAMLLRRFLPLNGGAAAR